uniref:CIP2A N-terminal domain-containing protein n=1 Tax=Peronospora matthiolae TaxID=2874970 RepID=A0AAV1UHE1_9STRA
MDNSALSATSASFLVAPALSAYHSQPPLKKCHNRPDRPALVVSVERYLASPSAATACTLHTIAQQLSTHSEIFSRNHTTLCLHLLDALADQVLAVAASSEALDVHSQTTQTQGTPEDVLPLLELCFLFARNAAIGYPSHQLCRLFQWLVKSVSVAALQSSCETDTGLKLQLLVLAKMTTRSAGIRLYVKEIQQIKDFYRSLTMLISNTEDAELLVCSMTILASLVLSEPVGSKLFSGKNVDQVFALAFSVLDESWDDGADENMSDVTTTTDRRPLLQMVSADLICNLADRREILELLEKYPKIAPTIGNCSMAINLNCEVEQIVVAAYFLSSVVPLSQVCRNMVIKRFSDQDVLYRVLQATLHPSKLAAITAARLISTVIGDDARSLRNLFDSAVNAERLSPIVAGMIRCTADATRLVQGAEDIAELSHSNEYLHAVVVCRLLAKLSALPAIRLLCVKSIGLNQSATLIQVESALIGAADPQDLISCHYSLSMHLVGLLSSIASDENMADRNKRTLNQFLQASEVALVLAAALFSRNDKSIVVEAVLLLAQSLASSENKRFRALELVEAIVGFSQRVGDASDILRSTIESLQTKVEVSAKSVESMQTEMQKMLCLHDQLKAERDRVTKDIEAKFAEQMRQKDDAMLKMRDAYEEKLRKVTAQCKSMGQHVNKNLIVLQQRESLLQENRVARGILEEENNELKLRVQALETRMEEITHAHSVATQEINLRDEKVKELRLECASISGDYAAQRDELAAAYDETKRLGTELSEHKLSNEITYKELVLLSKAHKALSDEKKDLENEIDIVRDELVNLESLNSSIQTRMREKKELVDQLERKISRLDDEATASKNAFEAECERCHAASRNLDHLRKAHRKLENDMAMLEIQAAEQRLVAESKDERLRKCEDEVCRLTKEIEQQVQLQALIHQLSSNVDNNVKASDGSSFLARDK